jgi:hypothetical protein
MKTEDLIMGVGLHSRFIIFDASVNVNELQMMFPDANIPIVQLSLKRGLNAAEHIAMAKQLLPLRDEGYLIIGRYILIHFHYFSFRVVETMNF